MLEARGEQGEGEYNSRPLIAGGRLARAYRDHAHFDTGLGGEDRQQVAEQPGLLGGGGRGDSDEAGNSGSERYTQGTSPFMKAAASAVAGRAKNSSIGARSMTRPACR